jgi:AcrR family transcriptional regulator
MTLRERGKARRRRRILDAAKTVIVKDGVDGLSMSRLATQAELSVATLYNLCGSKEDILYALLVDCLDSLDAALDRLNLRDPIARLRAITSTSVAQLSREARLYRPLMAAIDHQWGSSPLPAAVRRCEAMAEEALNAAVGQGLLVNTLSPRLLAHQIFMAYVQALRGWALGSLSDRGFLSQALHAQLLCLTAAATDRARPRLLRDLRSAEAGVRKIVDDMDALAKETSRGSAA